MLIIEKNQIFLEKKKLNHILYLGTSGFFFSIHIEYAINIECKMIRYILVEWVNRDTNLHSDSIRLDAGYKMLKTCFSFWS